MKLIWCKACSDIVALRFARRSCHCGKSWGRYLDALMAEIGGEATAIGFGDTSFHPAVRNQPDDGMGMRFEAFVIAKNCDTIIQR